jgi:Protein of unknown function (DUF736)
MHHQLRTQLIYPFTEALSAGNPSKKPVALGPPRCCGPSITHQRDGTLKLGFRLRAAAISGHASPGNGSQANIQWETSNDCNRFCPQRKRRSLHYRYRGDPRTVSIQAEIDIVPDQQKTSDSQPDFRVMTPSIKNGHRNRCGLAEDARNIGQEICQPVHRSPRIWSQETLRQSGPCRRF